VTRLTTGGPRRITLADVAREASVDRSVVSRVLTNDPVLNIREETRVRVLKAVRDLGYVPNASARSLRTAQTGTLGLFIPNFANPVYAEIISGAEAAASARGYVLMTGSSSSAGGTAESYLQLLGQGRVDGLLLAGEGLTPVARDALAAAGIPYLLLNRRTRGSRRYVTLDDAGAAELAVRHLLDLGHERIAHLAGPSGADTARRRQAGSVAALKAAGLSPDPELIVSAEYTSEGGSRGMKALLELRRRPTAVVVANFVAAVGALSAAHAAGLVVPRDLSVITIHDSPMAEQTVPALTTVRMPLRQMGARGVELLLGRAIDEEITEVVPGPIELMVRASTGRRGSTSVDQDGPS
jgi:LacI family transcriptional regulator